MKKQDYFDMGISGGISMSQIEAILCNILQISQTELFLLQEISSKYIYEVQQKIYKIKSGFPEEYTLGVANFYGRDFFVDERVLIPRNDTELLVKKLLRFIHTQGSVLDTIYVDVGVGSACIPVSIISEIHPLRFGESYGFDISEHALEVAQKNVNTFISDKIFLQKSNLLEAAFGNVKLQNKRLIITANLPYIKNGDRENMDSSVVNFEPDLALYGGSRTGFELYEKLLKQCFQLQHIYKIKSIDVFIEIGFDQYQYSKEFLLDLGLSFEYFPDSANIQRVIHIYGF